MNRSLKPLSCPQTAALSAFLCGAVTHLFGLVNTMHNYDDIAQQPTGYGTGVSSGRWFLSILGDAAHGLGLDYNLPVLNGLIFLALIAAGAGLVIRIFRIGSHKTAALIGMLFAVFPAAASTLTFRYTATYYGFGLFLSIAAVWVLRYKRFGHLLSALCTALSLGIYQAYTPLTITIFLLLLICHALEEDPPLWDLVRKGLSCCLALILGLVFYYLLMKLSLHLYGTQLSNYRGIDQMGQLSLRELPLLLKKAVYSVCMLPKTDYCGLAPTVLFRMLYLVIGLLSVGITGYLLLIRRRRVTTVLFVGLMYLLLPLGINFIRIMCPSSGIFTLMVYSFVMIPCIPLILWHQIPAAEDEKKKLPAALIQGVAAVLIFCYAYQTNVNYSAQYFATRQIENYLASMVTQIRMTEDFSTDLEWVFIGEIDDPLLRSYWQYELNYTGFEFTQPMLRRYSVLEWIRNYVGYSYPIPDEETVRAYYDDPAVQEMPCWPNAGSIKVIGNAVVIKCENVRYEDVDPA